MGGIVSCLVFILHSTKAKNVCFRDYYKKLRVDKESLVAGVGWGGPGWEVTQLGPMSQARQLDSKQLWCSLSTQTPWTTARTSIIAGPQHRIYPSSPASTCFPVASASASQVTSLPCKVWCLGTNLEEPRSYAQVQIQRKLGRHVLDFVLGKNSQEEVRSMQ